MPGSGKTTLGKQLAALVNLPFIDLDSEIEKKEGKSVSKIFNENGEPYFRQAEAETLRQTTAATFSFIMATGGGTPCFYDGIEFMNSVGVTVFLDVPVNELSNRLGKEQAGPRPLLQTDTTISETLEQIRLSRLKFYEQATFRVTNPELNDLIKLVTPKR